MARFAVTYLLAKKRKQSLSSRRMRLRRWTMFFRKQMNEYLVFTFMLSLASSIALTPVVRTVWEKPRTSDWWDNIVLSSFATNDWFSNFRMSQNTYLFLCDKLRPTIAKRDTIMRKAVTVEKRVAPLLVLSLSEWIAKIQVA